jgi:superfamily I DNA and/or RNA helicase
VIVAPYNAQVAEIRRRVRGRVEGELRVGTVDKFQGQEGAVVIYSMATSSPEEVPRNLEFLYSCQRLNVAISRARALAILVCSLDLMRFRCRTAEQMRQANSFCRFLEMATTLSPEGALAAAASEGAVSRK